MNTERRNFLKSTALATGGILFTDPLKKISGLTSHVPGLDHSVNTVSVYHTNDLHNQLQSFSTGNLSGLGGLQNISASIRQQDQPAILVDAGDFLHPSYSMAAHRKMIRAMNDLGYHAAAVGNKELEKGQAYLSELAEDMEFRMVNCNYSFSHEGLQRQVATYRIIKWGSYKIGITGVGTELDKGFMRAEGIGFHHPYERANAVAAQLKNQCDLVICLSHLGFTKKSGQFNSTEFASQSKNIDIIVSGHNDEVHAAPTVMKNKLKEEVIISHGGWGGLVTRQVSVTFRDGKKFLTNYRNFAPGEKSGESFHSTFTKISSALI
jgi:5'-nucleotidase